MQLRIGPVLTPLILKNLKKNLRNTDFETVEWLGAVDVIRRREQ